MHKQTDCIQVASGQSDPKKILRPAHGRNIPLVEFNKDLFLSPQPCFPGEIIKTWYDARGIIQVEHQIKEGNCSEK
jgi:hypothetical protein